MNLGPLNLSRTAFVAAVVALTLGMSAIPACAQTFTDLHDFNPGAGEPDNLLDTGQFPQGWDGKLFGISHFGGTTNVGTVFSMTLDGTPDIIHSFDSTGGSYPYYGVTLGKDGNFYGVVPVGGTDNFGTVYKITPGGTYTVLHNFTNGSDGEQPIFPPVQGNDGNFYGTTSAGTSTFYKVTPSGAFTTVHTFASSEGNQCTIFVLGIDGNFYGSCANIFGSSGTLFKISTAGHVTVLHNVNKATDGQGPIGLIQAADGNFYGAMSGGAAAGTIFQLKTNGTYKVLYAFTGGTDGGTPLAGLTQGRDGSLYGTAALGGQSTPCNGGCGVIYKITTLGAYSVIHTFDFTHGSYPQSDLTLDTDGVVYGNAQQGGAHGAGVFYSLNLGFKPFVTLATTSGKVGTKVGILGQGFDSASVVKFSGVKATAITLTGTTYITATVPAGAIDGKVTVTTGTTTLTSTQTFIVHNSWSSGSAMPTAVYGPAVGFINGKFYVVGGQNSAGTIVGTNQVYNPAANTWTTAAAIPTPVVAGASAVVGGILYVIGGYETSSTTTNIAQAYNPETNTWSTKATMPTARGSASAVVDGTSIYVIGGNGTSLRLNTVEKYAPSTNIWSEEAPLLVGKSDPSVGLVGTTIVAAGGYTTSGDTGDNEGYDVSTNTWSALTSDSTPRNASCYGALLGQLYVAAGGDDGIPQSITESFSVTTKKWTPVDAMPQALISPGSAVANGLLYCFGGSNSNQGTVYNKVHIYQP